MGNIRLNPAGALTGDDPDALIGITDLHVINGSDGPVLVSATRGDGWVTAFDVGSGDAALQDSWRISSSRLQLESTDLTVMNEGSGDQLLLAGLSGDALTGLRIGEDGFTGVRSHNASGLDMGDLRALTTQGDLGFAALRSGGLSVIDFSGSGTSARDVTSGDAINRELASAVAMLESGGVTYGFAAFGQEDALSAFRLTANGATALSTVTTDTVGGALGSPQALRAVDIGGDAYAIAAAADTGSLSVFRLTDAGDLTLVDQVMDSRDTRFADAAHLEVITVDDRVFVAAAGSDSGVSLFTLTPGGRLHHIDTVAATMDTPLRGVTDITLAAAGGELHIWAATQAAPYLVQFTSSGLEIGETVQLTDNGETVTGTSRDDVLIGGAGDDAIHGGAGRDVLQDGAGADTLTGGAGADTFVFSVDGTDDTVADFERGVDRLDLSSLPGLWDVDDLQVISRGWGAELRYRGEVTIVRSEDGERLDRDDIVEDGLTGIDRVSIAEARGQITGTLSDDMFRGTDDADAFDGQAGDDDLRGEGGNDTLIGNGGNDRLSGGFNEDMLYGGGGQDVITGDAGFDTIFGEAGGDFLNGGGQADLIHGGTGNDRLLGETGFDVLYGDEGQDTLLGGDTADRLYGGTGDDMLSGGVNVGSTVDGLFGEDGNDTLMGDGGFDFLDGGTGNDSLNGGRQADNLYGRSGADTLIGEDGLDRLFGGADDDLGYGGAGNDGLFGEQGADTLYGGTGNDRFFGGSGDDVLSGQDGNDTMHGGGGFDTITGGAGNDRMTGDFNADLFIFEEGHGQDQIDDFEAQNDFERISLAAITDITDFRDLADNHLSQSGNNAIIDTGGGRITLINVDVDDLDENDFSF